LIDPAALFVNASTRVRFFECVTHILVTTRKRFRFN
jgi:hypothetical protein